MTYKPRVTSMTLTQPLNISQDDLTPQQAMAFAMLQDFLAGDSDASMAVLRGFAGTGKTFLVSRLIAALDGRVTIAVAAPTNKAVKVLREKILATGTTLEDEPADGWRLAASEHVVFGSIHALLGLQLTEREDGSQECKTTRDPSLHKFDVVIVDECSMIGADLFRQIVACKRQTRILFVGDPAQLPPIESREAESPTFSQVLMQVTLHEVVRQAADNPIIKLALLLRRAIEEGQRVMPADISAILPGLHEDPQAGLVPGNAQTVIEFALYEIHHGRDARVLAFTNAAVNRYNQAIHEGIYGPQAPRFMVGERIMLHSQCEAVKGGQVGIKTTLITSEEAIITAIKPQTVHPAWPVIPASEIWLERDTGDEVAVYLPDNPEQVEQAITAAFKTWRELKAQSELSGAMGRQSPDKTTRENYQNEAARLMSQAKRASNQAWALRKAFAPLRHAYALTVHKSQGSTFDTAIVDFNDMQRIRSTFAFNRGLYVAATRPSQYLAIVAS